MRTSRRAAEIEPFEVMDVLSRAHALERAGRHVVHMEIGEPDFSAPAPVVEAGVRALREGRTAYTATLGLPELREAIAAHYQQKFKTRLDPSRVVVTAGASGGLLTVSALYVEPGDEVLVPDPGYPGYRHFVRAFEGRARALNVGAADNFQPTAAMVREAWGPRTKGLLLGSPSNPTGTLIPRKELAAIAAFIAERSGVLEAGERHVRVFEEVVERPWSHGTLLATSKILDTEPAQQYRLAIRVKPEIKAIVNGPLGCGTLDPGVECRLGQAFKRPFS